MKINLIVAYDSNFGIGKENNIPWKLKEDYLFFLDTTTKKYNNDKKNSIIMGKNTWRSLPTKGLKDRINIIVSNTITEDELLKENLTGEEVYLVKNIYEGINLSGKLGCGKVFICGGSNIYNEAIKSNIIDEIYETKIRENYECDTFITKEIENVDFQFKKKYKFRLFEQNKGKEIEVIFTKKYKKKEKSKNRSEEKYLKLLYKIILKGEEKETRNGLTTSLFGNMLKFNLNDERLPLLTTKKMFFRGIFEEFKFLISGETDTKKLSEKNINIWEANTNKEFLEKNNKKLNEFEMGPMYGYQLLHFNYPYQGANMDYENKGLNQLEKVCDLLEKDPNSRRIIMTTYNPLQAEEGVLYPCHGLLIQFYVDNNKNLSCMMTQRSVDTICGLGWNITNYSLLTILLAKKMKMKPGQLIMSLGDTHIYNTHKSAAIRQILREPNEFPKLKIKNERAELKDYNFEDIELEDYNHLNPIPVKMVA